MHESRTCPSNTLKILSSDTPNFYPEEDVLLGNLGVKQGLPDFLEIFSQSKAVERGWELDIHGGGEEKFRWIETLKETRGCHLGDVLDKDQYLVAMLSCTACLITQRPGVGANFLPSKLLPALATGTPVLAVCDRHSPLANEVLEGGFGEVVSPGDATALADILRKWQADPSKLVEFGSKAAERAELYGRNKILSRYLEELSVLSRHG